MKCYSYHDTYLYVRVRHQEPAESCQRVSMVEFQAELTLLIFLCLIDLVKTSKTYLALPLAGEKQNLDA